MPKKSMPSGPDELVAVAAIQPLVQQCQRKDKREQRSKRGQQYGDRHFLPLIAGSMTPALDQPRPERTRVPRDEGRRTGPSAGVSPGIGTGRMSSRTSDSRQNR